MKNIIFTSYFANRHILDDTYQVVNIAIGAPVWFPSRYIHFDECKPHIHTVGVWRKSIKDDRAKREYIYEYYKTILSKMTPYEWENILHQLVKEIRQNTGSNKIIVLSCYEKPKTFCHRLIFSIFINTILNIEILELGYPDAFECNDALLIKTVLIEIMTKENYMKKEN